MRPSTELVAQWRAAWARPTSGWSFDAFGDRLRGDEPPWSYPELAGRVLDGAASALDLGTGGGEVLLTLRDHLPTDTVATEGWPPNVPVATAALTPATIPVVAYDAETDPVLPFEDQRFDVVLSRHEAYDASEVARVLRPGGRFLTQQVDGRDLEDLSALLDHPAPYPHVRLDRFHDDALGAGLAVDEAQEWTGRLRFADVTTLLEYLRMVPWSVPQDFDVDRYLPALAGLHGAADLAFTQRRFVLVCRRPAR